MTTGNHFIDSLDPQDLALIQPNLKPVELKRDDLLTRTGEAVARAVLPVDSIVSVIVDMKDGRQVESRTIGREGGYGLLHALGSDYSYETVIVQVGGGAFAIDRRALTEAARRSPGLTEQIVRHAQSTIVQSARTTGCNALHDVRQRLCRWLLLTQDRLRRDSLPLKQEHLAIMLGVQRTTVTAVASQLQKSGAIRYSRGNVTVLNREALKACVCECYEAIEEAVRVMEGA
jgi:CRP-like cAMP-binding protein